MSNWIEIADSKCKIFLDSETIVDVSCCFPRDDRLYYRINISTEETCYNFDYPPSDVEKAEVLYNKLCDLIKSLD